jgi:iron complex outermembrane recepter protein
LDQVQLKLTDHQPNADRPETEGETTELTYHAGGNWIVIPGRILAYANTSTAFEPSTRIDSRTGQIQGNETTGGFELGVRGEEWDRRFRYSLHGFAFTNRNISRRNPLYRDPIADADQTQPALVAAGRESFQGATLEMSLQASEGLQLRGKAAFTDATTERSPDLPAEVGRALARVPRWTSVLSSQYRWTEGPLDGWSAGASLIYVSDYVDTYEDSRHAQVEYPGYTYTSLAFSYRWKKGRATNSLGLRLRNVFNENLLTRIARPGSEPSASLSFRSSY